MNGHIDAFAVQEACRCASRLIATAGYRRTTAKTCDKISFSIFFAARRDSTFRVVTGTDSFGASRVIVRSHRSRSTVDADGKSWRVTLDRRMTVILWTRSIVVVARMLRACCTCASTFGELSPAFLRDFGPSRARSARCPSTRFACTRASRELPCIE
jgi:hypothetical protein